MIRDKLIFSELKDVIISEIGNFKTVKDFEDAIVSYCESQIDLPEIGFLFVEEVKGWKVGPYADYVGQFNLKSDDIYRAQIRYKTTRERVFTEINSTTLGGWLDSFVIPKAVELDDRYVLQEGLDLLTITRKKELGEVEILTDRDIELIKGDVVSISSFKYDYVSPVID